MVVHSKGSRGRRICVTLRPASSNDKLPNNQDYIERPCQKKKKGIVFMFGELLKLGVSVPSVSCHLCTLGVNMRSDSSIPR